jgi:hypothetical protein
MRLAISFAGAVRFLRRCVGHHPWEALVAERVLPRDFPIVPQLIIPLSTAELQELGIFSAIWRQLDFLLLLTFLQIGRR